MLTLAGPISGLAPRYKSGTAAGTAVSHAMRRLLLLATLCLALASALRR